MVNANQVLPAYLRRRHRKIQVANAKPPFPGQVSPETPRPIGFNPTATAAPITIAR